MTCLFAPRSSVVLMRFRNACRRTDGFPTGNCGVTTTCVRPGRADESADGFATGNSQPEIFSGLLSLCHGWLVSNILLFPNDFLKCINFNGWLTCAAWPTTRWENHHDGNTRGPQASPSAATKEGQPPENPAKVFKATGGQEWSNLVCSMRVCWFCSNGVAASILFIMICSELM